MKLTKDDIVEIPTTPDALGSEIYKPTSRYISLDKLREVLKELKNKAYDMEYNHGQDTETVINVEDVDELFGEVLE